jgi:uroporphyrinogen-III decarboxylase
VKAAIGKRMCVMGNLDTIRDLGQKSEAEVFGITGRMVEAGKEDGGYIFCTGEGVVHSTPVGNIHAMVRAVREHGRYGARPETSARSWVAP